MPVTFEKRHHVGIVTLSRPEARNAWGADFNEGVARPRDLPIENVHRTSFAINLRTARTLGLTIPKLILDGADQVIQ